MSGTMNRSVALVLAGGTGSRMNLSVPKQFAVVDGFSVLQHTLQAFQKHQLISAVYVVASPQWQDVVKKQATDAGIDKFCKCLDAGENSFMSARNGIMSLCLTEEPETVVLIHDAVRPLVSQDIISRNIAVCLSRGNAITAIPSQESYMRISPDTANNTKETVSREYIPREQLLRAQTPHTFPLKELQAMMQQADEKGITYSQSIFTLANELGHVPLYTAEGEMTNFKLTLPSDLILFQAVLRAMRD